MLRAAILLNTSYVSLCLEDSVVALENAQNILLYDQYKSVTSNSSNGNTFILPGGYKLLAHIYAADALIQLDRLSEAITHVDPTSRTWNTLDFSFTIENSALLNSNAADDSDINPSVKNNTGKKSAGIKSAGEEGNLSGAVNAASPRRQAQVATVNAVLQYNLIVALAIRGEWEKADEMVETLWKKNGNSAFVY